MCASGPVPPENSVGVVAAGFMSTVSWTSEFAVCLIWTVTRLEIVGYVDFSSPEKEHVQGSIMGHESRMVKELGRAKYRAFRALV